MKFTPLKAVAPKIKEDDSDTITPQALGTDTKKIRPPSVAKVTPGRKAAIARRMQR